MEAVEALEAVKKLKRQTLSSVGAQVTITWSEFKAFCLNETSSSSGIKSGARFQPTKRWMNIIMEQKVSSRLASKWKLIVELVHFECCCCCCCWTVSMKQAAPTTSGQWADDDDDDDDRLLCVCTNRWSSKVTTTRAHKTHRALIIMQASEQRESTLSQLLDDGCDSSTNNS